MNYKTHSIIFFIIPLLLITACRQQYPSGSFGDDLHTLQNVQDLHVLKSGNAMVAVSGALQGRIFTSSAKGMTGYSFGWFNKKPIADQTYQNAIAGLGGEGRIWFGPEVGKFGLFFQPHTQQVSANVVTPPALNQATFEVLSQNDTSLVSRGTLHLVSYAETLFDIEVTRQVRILSARSISKNLGITLPQGVACVGFSAETRMTNIGADWQKNKGLLALWELGCMHPEPGATVMIPTNGKHEHMRIYFSPLDENRLQIMDSVVFYKADADYLNKIGIAPRYAKPIFGSYLPKKQILTIVQYSLERDAPYVNSHWENQDDPYAGDVINIFNDGVTADAGPFGPFYEMETSSSARELKTGASHKHIHNTYHFQGTKSGLRKLAKEILGVDLAKAEAAFKK